MSFPYDPTGTVLDRRYKITGKVGQGGMGHVYAATHVALQQKVAIKVLHPRFAGEERFRERFIREARSASSIDHRNVVRISDFGDTPDGSVYFVMEFLEGLDVGQELRKVKAMKWPRARHVLLQAVSALRAAHAKDIIHRDIKPGNCFLTTDAQDGADFVKLLDFGIAKVGRDSHDDAQSKGLTGTGEVFGTATYMSPEQAYGNELDARSDMYSLGIMAYQMLTGQVPFPGTNAIHIITRHMQDVPESLCSVEPSIPAEVEEIVLKTIAKKPDERYESMEALEDALRSVPESDGRARSRRTRVWKGAKPVKPVVGAKRGLGEPTALVPPRVAAGRPASVNKRTFARPAPPALVSQEAPGSLRPPSVPPAPPPPPSPRPRPPPPPPSSSRPPPPPGSDPSIELLLVESSDGGSPLPGSGSSPNTVPVPASGHDAGGLSGGAGSAGWGTADGTNPPPGSGSSPNTVPVPGSAGWGTADGTNPPPGSREYLVAPTTAAVAWGSGSASTGPFPAVGDSSTETGLPQMVSGDGSAITRRMIAVVMVMVFLVGGVSAVVTIVVLSGQKKAEAKTEAVVPEPVPAVPDPVSAVPAAPAAGDQAESEASGEIGGGEDGPGVAGGDEGSGGGLGESTSSEGSGGGRTDEVPAEQDGDLVMDGGGQGATTTAVKLDDTNAVASADAEPSKPPSSSTPPKTPKHESQACEKTRGDTEVAFKDRSWGVVARLARKRQCWPSATQGSRLNMYVRALLELGRFEDCIKAGRRSKDAVVRKMVWVCENKAKK